MYSEKVLQANSEKLILDSERNPFSDLMDQFKNALIKPKQSTIKKQLVLEKIYIADYIKCFCLFEIRGNIKKPVNAYPFDIPIVENVCGEYQDKILIPKKDWSKYKDQIYSFIRNQRKKTEAIYKVEIVSVTISKEIETGFYKEKNIYSVLKPNFINLGKGHYIVKSETDVVYHYYKSQVKSSKSTYRSKFHRRQLEYRGWFYDLPTGFNIKTDWQSVYASYLVHKIFIQ